MGLNEVLGNLVAYDQKPVVANCECLIGTPYTKSDGSCGCDNTGSILPVPTVRRSRLRTKPLRDLNDQRVNRLQQQIQNLLKKNKTTVETIQTTGTSNNFSGITDFLQNNKLLVGAVVLGAGYYFFMGSGGKFAGKTRTDITRWGS